MHIVTLVALASREFLTKPHMTPLRDVMVVEDLIWAITLSGNGLMDIARSKKYVL
jgi:hypothetical protein